MSVSHFFIILYIGDKYDCSTDKHLGRLTEKDCAVRSHFGRHRHRLHTLRAVAADNAENFVDLFVGGANEQSCVAGERNPPVVAILVNWICSSVSARQTSPASFLLTIAVIIFMVSVILSIQNKIGFRLI